MRVVQFMHPGDEFPVTGRPIGTNGIPVGWNMRGRHYRRLLCHEGSYVDGNGSILNGTLCFWNEYEAPTTAYPIQQGQTGWNYAKRYHKIVKPIPPSSRHNQNHGDFQLDKCCDNTDPCVFGDTFKYSNCQQVPNGDLWNLPPGSLILFGSCHANGFYLDTVFVTETAGGTYQVPTLCNNPPFTVSGNYRTVTLDNLMPRRNNRTGVMINEFMFYRGKLPKINGRHVAGGDIFSFTPSRIFNSTNYNERCRLDLNALNVRLRQVLVRHKNFSTGLTQNHKTIAFNANQMDVSAIWHEVRDAVLKALFVLGYQFPW